MTNAINRLRSSLGRRKAVVFGRRSWVSAWVWITAVVSTVAVAGVVALTTVRYTPTGPTTEGSIALHSPTYTQLWELFTATFGGNFEHPLLLGGAVVLLAGAVVSAYLNSGILPTSGFVMGPIFGLFVNRVGTPVPVIDTSVPGGLGYAPMSLLDAIGWGIESALFIGTPIVLIGFIIGSLLRWIAAPKSIIQTLRRPGPDG